MFSPDDKLIEEALRHFSNELHEALPIRHFGEFHDLDEDQLKVVFEQRRNIVFKKVFAKIWNREKEEIVTLFMKLNGRMKKEVIAEWMKKNSEHRVKSLSFLQKKIEMICDDFNMALEDQLDLNPDMEFESLKNYVMSRKLFAINWYEKMWKPGNVQIQEERKVKLKKHLDTLAEEVLEKQKLHFERKASENGNDLLDEVKLIVLEKSRQLKCYVNSHQQRASICRFKGKVESIQEYLLNCKNCALKGTHGEMYFKLLKTLEGEIKFLTEDETEGNAKSAEELVRWVEGLDAKLRFSFQEWTNQAQGVITHPETNESDGQAAWATMQNILKEDPFSLWEPEETKTEVRTRPPGNAEKSRGQAVAIRKKKVAEVPMTSINDKRPDLSQIPRPTANGMRGRRRDHQSFTDGKTSATTGENGVKRRRSRRLSSSSKDMDSNGHFKARAATTSDVVPPKQFETGTRKSSASAITPRRSSRLNKTCNSIDATSTSPGISIRHRKKIAKDLDRNKNARQVVEEKHSSLSPKVLKSSTCSAGRHDLLLPEARKRGRFSRSTEACFAKITILKGGGPTYLCNVCKKRFRNRDYVVRFHGDLCGKEEKTFICSECGKRFSRKHHLQSHHLRIHCGEKPFKCPKCPARFASNSHMNKHIRCHARGNRFICKACNVGFVSQRGLHDHNMTHSDISHLSLGCSYCDKRYDDMYKLRRHVVHHSDERPFKCPTCEAAFATKQVLLVHIRGIHRQPSKIAQKLANQAALDYLMEETNKSYSDVSSASINSRVISHVIRKAKLQLPNGATATTTDASKYL